MKGEGQIDRPQKKLPSKRPALLGLTTIRVFLLTCETDKQKQSLTDFFQNRAS